MCFGNLVCVNPCCQRDNLNVDASWNSLVNTMYSEASNFFRELLMQRLRPEVCADIVPSIVHDMYFGVHFPFLLLQFVLPLSVISTTRPIFLFRLIRFFLLHALRL